MNKYYCIECGIKPPFKTYDTLEELIKNHPTLKDHPELIETIEGEMPLQTVD